MGGSAPTPPPAMDPNSVANTQQTYTTGSQQASNPNYYNPYGSQTFSQTGTGPNGIPTYSVNTQLAPWAQSLTQGLTGAAGNLLGGANYGSISPSEAIGSATSGLTSQMMGNEMTYLDPFFKNQQNWANSYLANQGIDPKSNPAAYYNYMNQNVYQPQGQTVAGAAAQFQPQAFSEAATMYGMPASLASSLLGTAAPILAGPTTAAAATPFSGQQPVNYGALATAAQQQAVQEYQAKLAQYQQNLGGIYGLAGTGLALAAAPFTGGASLMALPAMSGRALGGLFSSAPSSGGFSNVGDVTYAP